MKKSTNQFQQSYSIHNNNGRSQRNIRLRRFVSEFFGTLFLVFLGQSALTSFELMGTQSDIISRQSATTFAYALSFLIATSLTLSSSGAHLNPAYSLASATYGYNSWGQATVSMLAQYLGSFTAAILLHASYSDKITQRHSVGMLLGKNATQRAHGHILSTGKFFSSYPATEVSLFQLIVSYTIATTHLFIIILAIQDAKLVRISKQVKPLYMAAALALTLLSFSANGGPVLNPAQDFSPRLYTAMFGWGTAAFDLHHYHYWWLCGLMAPHFGAIIGFGLYQILIGLGSEINHHRVNCESDDDDS